MDICRVVFDKVLELAEKDETGNIMRRVFAHAKELAMNVSEGAEDLGMAVGVHNVEVIK